jgi:hypothetical protein
MSRPPRIPNWLPWEQSTIYFITLCIEGRKPVLANVQAWKICRAVFNKLDQWRILSAIVMPDHLHVLAAPTDRNASVSDFAKWFKRWFNEAYRTSKCRPSVSDGAPWLGDGKKVVSIACCDLMNPCRTNGNTSDRIRSAAALSNIRTTGHTSFNSTLSELASDTDALQSGS